MALLPTIDDLTKHAQGGGAIANVFNALTNQALLQRKQELANRYYGPNIESEMANRNALTTGQNIKNKYLPDQMRLANAINELNLKYAEPSLQSQLQQLQIKTKQNELINQALRGAFNGQDSGSGAMQAPVKVQEQGNPNDIQNFIPQLSGLNSSQIPATNANNIPITSPMQQQPVSNGMTYPKAAILNKLMGLGSPHIEDINGQKIAVTPWGNFPVAQGLTPSQEAYQKGKGKYAAESYGQSVDSYKAMQNQGVALDQLIGALDNPEFENVTGPVSSFLTNWAGTPERQELLGSMRTASGEIALQVAPSLKGAFTGRDQTLINTIKANPDTDFPDVFRGKVKAQKLTNTLLSERARLGALYIDSGMSPLQAHEKAAKDTPLEKLKPLIDKLITPKFITIKNPSTNESKRISADEARKMIKNGKLKINPGQAQQLGVK